MDIRDSHNGVPCNHTFRDITNTEVTAACLPAEKPTLPCINGEISRKRKTPFHPNEVIHQPQAYEAHRIVKEKVYSVINAKPYDSQSKENNYSHGDGLVNILAIKGASAQISKPNNVADETSIGHIASSKSEDEDLSTESDEPKQTHAMDKQLLRYPIQSNRDHEEPAFSNHYSLDHPLPSKKKAVVKDILAHQKHQNINLCGSCSCPSCIKAAYMWSDLIYQDTRGRLSALKLSRRHARSLLDGKIDKQEKAGQTSQSHLRKVRSTESDLLEHWTSLFHRTEDILLCEIMQTQSRLIEIEKLKDKFRNDLEALTSQNEPEE